MTQNAKKPEQQNPMAVWFKTLEQTQQMTQDNTLKVINNIFEAQRRFMRALSNMPDQQD